jgi:hypothetical protein
LFRTIRLRNAAFLADVDSQARKRAEEDQMLETFKVSSLTMMLMAWSAIAVAQTSPGGTPGGGAAPPAGTTTDAAGEGTDWLWIIALIAVVAVVLFYFLRRGRSTRI